MSKRTYSYSVTEGWIDKPDELTAAIFNYIVSMTPFLRPCQQKFKRFNNIPSKIEFDLPEIKAGMAER